MITWIQRTFQRHTKLALLFLLLVITIPFVFTIGASPGIGQGGRKIIDQTFYGVNLGNPEQARRLFLDGQLSSQLKAGYNALQGAQAQQYAFQRIAGLALADELHLPSPSADQVAKYVTTLRAFHNEQGQFDQKRYASFGDQIKSDGQLTVADVNRVLRDDTRLEQLSKVIGGPGYVSASDVQEQLTRADTQWTVQVATLDYAGFNPSIPANDDVLKKFHEENAFRYDVPARPRFSYVEFKGSDYLPPTSPSEEELRAFYHSNPAAFPVPPEAGKTDAPALDATTDNFPKVRAQVEARLKEQVSARLATKAANDLTIALYEKKIPANSPELTNFLAAQRRPVISVAPFAPGTTPPADKAWLANYTDQIARLSKDRYFSDPLPTTDSFVVLLWNETLPAYTPLFAEVRERVLADYKDDTKRKLFVARGKTLQAQLSAAAKKGAVAFAETAAAEKLTVKSHAGFTLRQPPSDMPYPAFSALQTLEAGQVSDMAATAEQGILVYAQEKKLPDLTPGNPRYAEVEKQLRQYTASSTENAYLAELVERELKKQAPAAATN